MSPAIAIMQPYLFPYLPYFGLVHNSEEFVFYDDVNYIKGGWINRNRLLVNGCIKYFSVPLHQASSFRKICEIETFNFLTFRRKFMNKLAQNYASAPFRERGMGYAELVLSSHSGYIAPLAERSVTAACEILGLEANFVRSSVDHSSSNGFSGVERVLRIVKDSFKNAYINPYGGKSLYSAEAFREAGVELRFVDPAAEGCLDANDARPGDLSILHDLFMFSLEELRDQIKQYRVVVA